MANQRVIRPYYVAKLLIAGAVEGRTSVGKPFYTLWDTIYVAADSGGFQIRNRIGKKQHYYAPFQSPVDEFYEVLETLLNTGPSAVVS